VGGSATRDRPLRVRADESLVPRIQRTGRVSTVWVATREPVRVNQAIRIEFGLGPLADEIVVDAVVREVRADADPLDAPEVLCEIDRRHDERFAYVYDVIRGLREVVTRRYRRVAARFPVVWTHEGRSHRSFTGDIAAGGAFVVAPGAPEAGAMIELEMWLDADAPIEVSGLVTWVGQSRGEGGFGVQFRHLDAGAFNVLRDLVRRRDGS
jgi:hypothetical protein